MKYLKCKCKKINVQPDNSRDKLITDGMKALYEQSYGYTDNYQFLFQKICETYCNNCKLADKIYEYMSKLWFMPSTPVLRYVTGVDNAPISCFMNTCVPENHASLMTQINNFVYQISGGGGVSVNLSSIPSIETVSTSGYLYGAINFIYMFESLNTLVKKRNSRTSAICYYLRFNHPEIFEFVGFRLPDSTGVSRLFSSNVHICVIVTDEFLEAVRADKEINLIDVDGSITKTIKARKLWLYIIKARYETGEPFIYFKDNSEKHKAEVFKKLNIEIGVSNLCTEMNNPSCIDHLGNMRSGSCCLGSLNLSKYDEYKDRFEEIVENCLLFLDDVLSEYRKIIVENRNKHNDVKMLGTCLYSIDRTRAVGLGVCGWHDYLQKKDLPFTSEGAMEQNREIFGRMKRAAMIGNENIGRARGACLDCKEAGMPYRAALSLAIAPTMHISRLLGTSPGINPWIANYYSHKSTDSFHFFINPNLLAELKQYYNEAQLEGVIDAIAKKSGSLKGVDLHPNINKEKYLTAHEINQDRFLDQCIDRANLMTGEHTQSYNIFVGHMSLNDIVKLHLKAGKMGICTMYYCHNKPESARSEESSCSTCGS